MKITFYDPANTWLQVQINTRFLDEIVRYIRVLQEYQALKLDLNYFSYVRESLWQKTAECTLKIKEAKIETVAAT